MLFLSGIGVGGKSLEYNINTVLMIGVALRAHKLEIQVMNTANTPPTQKLLKTQRAVMRELRRGSFLNVYIIHFPFFVVVVVVF